VIADINVGILYLFAISSLGVYGIIMGGWASNSKYPFLGALRSAAQMVSYEVSIGFVIITVLLCVGSLNLTDIVERRPARTGARNGITSRTAAAVPDVRDLLHLGAGRNQPPAVRSAGSGIRTRRRLHGRILARRRICCSCSANTSPSSLMCAMTTILFLGGWLPPGRERAVHLGAGRRLVRAEDLLLVFFMFAMVKAIVPRYRYDQLMRLGWKVFLPTWSSLAWSSSSRLAATPSPSLGRAELDTLAHEALNSAPPAALLLSRVRPAHLPDDALFLREAQGDAELSVREGPAVARASAASMRCAAIPTARSAASPASCARRSARRRPSPSRPNRARTARAAPRATTSTW
jgi:hypothetical protein